MNYTADFKELINKNENNSFIGLGNPNSSILIVGKEVSTNSKSDDPLEIQNTISYRRNSIDWKKNIEDNITQEQVKEWVFIKEQNIENINNNPLFAFNGTIKKKTSNTWKNYQKLFEIIKTGSIDHDNNKVLTFQKGFFLTEMSDIPSPKTKNAQQIENFKINLEHRKSTFFRSEFIQNFPIVVLACSNYIWNKRNDKQIDDIFKVKFDNEKKFSNGEYVFSQGNRFWAHFSDSGSKLVIHTRQLSMNVLDSMLLEMGVLIRNHKKNWKL